MSDTEKQLGWGLVGSGGGAWTPPSAEDLAEAIPGLRVLGLAGRGGMGAVYRAEQTRLGRTVAVKVLPAGATADPLARERFEREARVLAALNHPRVLRVFDFGVLPGGAPYLVAEWAEGGDLAMVLAGRAQEPRQVAAWVAQIAEALDAVHAKGVVHRDLKPANVLVRADGGLALGDFGVARAEGAGFTTALTMSGVVFGTADYMAPEQRGAVEVTKAADIYALGVMAYQMLTGRVPRGLFAAASKAAGLSKAVDAVIEAALSSEPERRPRSARELARALERALKAKRRKIWPAGVLAVLAAVGAGLWLAWNGAPDRTPKPEPRIAASENVAAPPPARETRDLLAGFRPEMAARRGGWSMRGAELASDGQACWIALEAKVSPDFHYEVELEFTRLAGRHSVGVFLPTAAGIGVFELDAWERGLGGWQLIDGRDLRENGTGFPSSLRNGERQRLRLRVEGARVSAAWNAGPEVVVDLAGRRFSAPEIWEADALAGIGLCAWQSPTVFHRVEYRALGGD